MTSCWASPGEAPFHWISLRSTSGLGLPRLRPARPAAGLAEQARDRLLSALRVIREEQAATHEFLALVPLALGHFALGDLAAARHVGEQARDVARRFGNAPAVELLTRHLNALDAASASTT